ncbi:MAG: rRNA processing protein RimM [Pseudomonadota bacterium]|jgi:16S rRNA processing protein RimM
MGQSSLILEKNDGVVVGRIGRPFGVRGWVHVHSFTEVPERLFSYRDWHLKKGKSDPVPTKCDAYKIHGVAYVAKLIDCDDRDIAATWTNAEILVPREVLPELPEGEYYWQDLIGLTVYNLSGYCFGVIEEFWETKANDILVIKQQETGKETLIPYVPEAYDIQVDIDKQTVTVDWPEDF